MDFTNLFEAAEGLTTAGSARLRGVEGFGIQENLLSNLVGSNFVISSLWILSQGHKNLFFLNAKWPPKNKWPTDCKPLNH